MKKIIIYSTPTCVYCKMAREYFKANKIEFTEHNVAEDEAALKDMLKKSGQMGVPVIDIGGEIFIGFNKPDVARAVGL